MQSSRDGNTLVTWIVAVTATAYINALNLNIQKQISLFCGSLHGAVYREAVTRAICYYYYPPCGNSTHFAPPNALCQDVCFYLAFDLCSEEELALEFLSGMERNIDDPNDQQLPFLNCNQPGAPLGILPHCCSDAGIDIMDITPGEILVESDQTLDYGLQPYSPREPFLSNSLHALGKRG